MYDVKLDFLTYSGLKNTIQAGAKGYGIMLSKTTNHERPRLPLLFSLATQDKKGCRKFYKVLKARDISMSQTIKCESRWHDKLNCVLSITFWDRCWNLVSKIQLENKLRWIQIQILRGILPTNKAVNRFVATVQPNCTFCQSEIETILHLFWECPSVIAVWHGLENQLSPYLYLDLNKRKVLFGDKDNLFTNTNMIFLLVKFFIWKARCSKTEPTLAGLTNFLRYQIDTFYIIARMKGAVDEFYNLWDTFLDVYPVSLSDAVRATFE